MGFHELIQQGREPGENGLPEDYFDSLAAEYTTLMDGYAARQAEIDAQMQERQQEIARLKSVNYDLLMASRTGDERDQEQERREPEDNFDNPRGIDSLFE